MKRRSFLLVEVLAGLALLAALGTWLLTVQTASLRQLHHAEVRRQAAIHAEALLWQWSLEKTPVTLPANGRLSDTLSWRREATPLRITSDLIPTQVSLVIVHQAPGEPARDAYRVDWLVADRKSKGER